MKTKLIIPLEKQKNALLLYLDICYYLCVCILLWFYINVECWLLSYFLLIYLTVTFKIVLKGNVYVTLLYVVSYFILLLSMSVLLLYILSLKKKRLCYMVE